MVKKSAATVVPGAASGDVNGDSNQNNSSNASGGAQQVIVVPESAQSAEVWEEISRELRGVTDERDRAALRLLPAHQEMRLSDDYKSSGYKRRRRIIYQQPADGLH